MRRLCPVVLVAASLFAVSCGSGSDDDGAEQTTPSDTEATEAETPDTTALDSDDSDTDTPDAETSESGDGTDGDGEDEPEPEPVVLTDSWAGVTAETIKVGVAGIDFARLQEFGVDIEGVTTDVWAPA